MVHPLDNPLLPVEAGDPPQVTHAKGSSRARRMTGKEYRNLFMMPTAKQRRVQLLHSPTPSSDKGAQTDEDKEEDPEEPEYATEHSAA